MAGDRMVISAPESGGGPGRVATLTRDGAGWAADPSKLANDAIDNGARFGFAVAIAGDLLVVGSSLRDVGTSPDANSVLDCLRKANWDPVIAAPCIEAVMMTNPPE